MMPLSKNDQDFITKVLKLPNTWVSTSLALCYQHFFLNEKAIDTWFTAKNIPQAHKIFYERVLPLYMHKSTSVSMVKALQQSDEEYVQATKRAWIESNQVCARKEAVNELVKRFQAANINLFQQQTGLFKKFADLISKLCRTTHGGAAEAGFNLIRVREMQE